MTQKGKSRSEEQKLHLIILWILQNTQSKTILLMITYWLDMVSVCKTPYWMPGNFSNTMDDGTCLEHDQSSVHLLQYFNWEQEHALKWISCWSTSHSSLRMCELDYLLTRWSQWHLMIHNSLSTGWPGCRSRLELGLFHQKINFLDHCLIRFHHLLYILHLLSRMNE